MLHYFAKKNSKLEKILNWVYYYCKHSYSLSSLTTQQLLCLNVLVKNLKLLNGEIAIYWISQIDWFTYNLV